MKRNGFTLIELMVTIAMVAILLTVGVPSMRDLILNNDLTATTNTWVSSLNIARSEAIKQGRNATICVSDNQATCSGTNWRLGWLSWVDSNANGAMDAPAEIIRIVEPQSANITITLAQSSLQIDPQGTVSNPNTTATICDSRTGEIGRQLRVLATGGISLNRQFACP